MIASIINFSQLEDRIDAEYFKPEYLKLEKILNNQENITELNSLAKEINCGPFGSLILKEHYLNKGLPLLRITNLKDIIIDEEDLFFINQELDNKLKKYIVNPYDIVASQRGTIGIFAQVNNSYSNWIISANLIAIKQSERINFTYLLILLNSKYGINQLKRKISGQIQEKITTDDIKSLKIYVAPSSFQQHIEDLVKLSFEKRKQAEEKYQEAEKILEKELEIEGFDFEKTEKTFEAKFSEINDRLDAEYYQPKYNLINKLLNNQKTITKQLCDLVKIRKGIEVGHEAYIDKGIPFIRVADFNEKEVEISSSTNFIRSYLYTQLKKIHKPNPDEIIFSKDGTIGKALVVSNSFNEFIVSSGILILSPRNIDHYYLSLVLNSPLTKQQTQRNSIGTVIQHLQIDQTKKIKIPVLSQNVQRRISSCIQQSFSLRQESKELLEKAKKEVEELIEKRK